MQHDVLELDPGCGAAAQDAEQLLGDCVDVATEGEGVGVRLAEEADRSAGLEQVWVMVEVGPDAVLAP